MVASAISLKCIALILSQLHLEPAHDLYRSDRSSDPGGAHRQEEDDARHARFPHGHR
jgi:hypothetical protein